MMDYLAETPLPDPDIISMPELAEEIATGSGSMSAMTGRNAVPRPDDDGAHPLNLAQRGEGRRIAHIDIWRAGRLGVVDIADDGPGSRDQWVDLFLAFRSRSRGGTGLGLAIARDLAVAQGGN